MVTKCWRQNHGGDGGFFLACEDFECLTIHSPSALSLIFSFFFEMEISLCTLIPLFMLGSVQNGSAS